MNELDSDIKKFRDTILNVLLSMDPDTAVEFVRVFNEKINEQNSTKKNTGPSR